MAVIPYTKQMLIERVYKQLASDFPGADFKILDEEIVALLDSQIPFVMKAAIFENAKVDGIFAVPDAYIVQYSFVIKNQDDNTTEWFVTLPQPPLSLPTGYDITNVYVANGSNGRGMNAMPLISKRQGYRDFMPKPFGYFYRVLGQTMYLKTTNGQPMLNERLSVEMPISRTSDLNAPLSMPDDAIKPLVDATVASLAQRFQLPKDIILDNQPAGAKTS